MEIREISIPVPWGHIAAKTWGNPSNQPILTLHGISDNAGAYDLLIPNLPETYYYVCPDFPGHGLSTHNPYPLLGTLMDYTPVCRYIVKHFGWKKITIIGHSMGGHIAIKYYELYPDDVLGLILLDAPYFPAYNLKYYNERFAWKIDNFVNFYKKKENPFYTTYEEIVEKIRTTRFMGTDLSEEAAKALARRDVMQENYKFYFRHDPSLKYLMVPPYEVESVVKIVKNFKLECPVLHIISAKNSYTANDLKPIAEAWKTHPRCVVTYIDAHHDGHMEKPELIAQLICDFLKLYRKSKL